MHKITKRILKQIELDDIGNTRYASNPRLNHRTPNHVQRMHQNLVSQAYEKI